MAAPHPSSTRPGRARAASDGSDAKSPDSSAESSSGRQRGPALGPESDPSPGSDRSPVRNGVLVRSEAWFLHAANLLVGGTGLVYGWMSYLLEPVDEWAIVNHRWQPDVQHLHVLTAPLLVFAVGFIWRDHVWGRIRRGVRARRRAGLGLALSFLPMAASGYLVQVATDEVWRLVWAWVHGATSLLWIGAYAAHQLARKRARRPADRV